MSLIGTGGRISGRKLLMTDAEIKAMERRMGDHRRTLMGIL
jgi:hypothetical protein